MRPDTEAMHHTSGSVFDLTMCMFGTFDFYNYINLSWKCDITIIIIIDNVHSMIIIKDNVLYTLSSIFFICLLCTLNSINIFKQKLNTWWWLAILKILVIISIKYCGYGFTSSILLVLFCAVLFSAALFFFQLPSSILSSVVKSWGIREEVIPVSNTCAT